MNTQMTPDDAAGVGRMAWQIGLNEAQLWAVFRSLGHPEHDPVSRQGIRAFRHVAIDLDTEAPGTAPVGVADKPNPAAPSMAMDGPTLAAWRQRMGYSQRDAAKALGCSRGALAGWEAGQAIPRYIGLACAALALGMNAYGEKGTA
jgi:DNA-binding XRE family transcriptional regulator